MSMSTYYNHRHIQEVFARHIMRCNTEQQLGKDFLVTDFDCCAFMVDSQTELPTSEVNKTSLEQNHGEKAGTIPLTRLWVFVNKATLVLRSVFLNSRVLLQ